MDRAQEIGLFRWQIVGEATDVSLSARERGRLVRALAEREHLAPDGRWVRVGRNTLDRWIRAYREGGFDALVPAPRRPAKGTPERFGVGGRAAARAARSDGGADPQDHRGGRGRGAVGADDPAALDGGRGCRGRAARSRERSGGSRPRRATSCGPGTRCTAR